MRSRNHRISVWLNDAEFEKFTRSMKLSGISKAASLRHLINGYTPKERPSHDYFTMMEELRNIGTGINHLMNIAHTTKQLDKVELNEILMLYRNTLREITKAMIEPEKF
jgi:hypothetical protein